MFDFCPIPWLSAVPRRNMTPSLTDGVVMSGLKYKVLLALILALAAPTMAECVTPIPSGSFVVTCGGPVTC
ncbi:hypothetical protein [Mycobacterium sp.]|uniref:hypothetical protein n=1 Tax=Mycobacterium sp. TaxID=1785 RepID=UPI003D6BB61F